MCFDSVLIPPVNRGPPYFFLIWIASKWHILCKFWGAVCDNQLQFWNRILIHLCIILNKSIVCEYFFLARDRSLKSNTSFPVLYFDEVSMYKLNSRISGIQTDLCPFNKVRRSMCPLLPWPLDLNPFRYVWHRQGHLCPPPLKIWEGHVSPLSADPRWHVINSEMSDIGRVTCAPLLLKLWEGHVLPSPFPLLIHSEMFHRLGHLCPLLKS